MAEYMMPAPRGGAGNDAGRTKPQDRIDLTPIWACREISNCPCAVEYAADRALDYAETVHDFDCEDRGRLFPGPIFDRCADPLLLIDFLPFDVIDPVRRAAERRLRAWPM